MTQPALVPIGLIGADATLTAACKATLAGVAEVLPQSSTIAPSVAAKLAAVILALPQAEQAAVQRFEDLHAAHPDLKIFLLGSEIPVNVVVELLKAGAEDYLELPYDALALRRKLDRALGLPGDPSETSLLQSVMSGERNRRNSYRAKTPDAPATRVRLPLNHAAVDLQVLDLSLASDRLLGGMSWLATPIAANELPLSTWTRGTIVPFHLDLPGARIKIPGKAIIVRVTLPPPGPVKEPFEIGVQYTVDNPYDERLIAKFWAECQRTQMSGERRETPYPR